VRSLQSLCGRSAASEAATDYGDRLGGKRTPIATLLMLAQGAVAAVSRGEDIHPEVEPPALTVDELFAHTTPIRSIDELARDSIVDDDDSKSSSPTSGRCAPRTRPRAPGPARSFRICAWSGGAEMRVAIRSGARPRLRRGRRQSLLGLVATVARTP
jgi:hypothetical protein